MDLFRGKNSRSEIRQERKTREILNETNTISVGQIKYISQWKKIVKYPWILKTSKVMKFFFNEKPLPIRPKKNQISFNDHEIMVVNDEINELLRKDAIREIDESDDLFIYNLFVVPMKNEKLRPIINLRSLYEFVSFEKFRQENLN